MQNYFLSYASQAVRETINKKEGIEPKTATLEEIELIYSEREIKALNNLLYYRFVNALIFFFLFAISCILDFWNVLNAALFLAYIYQFIHLWNCYLEHKAYLKRVQNYVNKRDRI